MSRLSDTFSFGLFIELSFGLFNKPAPGGRPRFFCSEPPGPTAGVVLVGNIASVFAFCNVGVTRSEKMESHGHLKLENSEETSKSSLWCILNLIYIKYTVIIT